MIPTPERSQLPGPAAGGSRHRAVPFWVCGLFSRPCPPDDLCSTELQVLEPANGYWLNTYCVSVKWWDTKLPLRHLGTQTSEKQSSNKPANRSEEGKVPRLGDRGGFLEEAHMAPQVPDLRQDPWSRSTQCLPQPPRPSQHGRSCCSKTGTG